jgi:hypothetical protein
MCIKRSFYSSLYWRFQPDRLGMKNKQKASGLGKKKSKTIFVWRWDYFVYVDNPKETAATTKTMNYLDKHVQQSWKIQDR